MTRISSYEDADWRFTRLNNLVAAVRTVFALSSHSRLDELDRELIEVHDHKGSLEVNWRSKEGLKAFKELVDVAWELQNEPRSNNGHDVVGAQ